MEYAVGEIVGSLYNAVIQLFRRKRKISEGLVKGQTVWLSGKLQSDIMLLAIL